MQHRSGGRLAVVQSIRRGVCYYLNENRPWDYQLLVDIDAH